MSSLPGFAKQLNGLKLAAFCYAAVQIISYSENVLFHLLLGNLFFVPGLCVFVFVLQG